MEHDLTMDAEHVAGLCILREWTWADLADAMRMSKSTVSRVARGDTLPGRKFIFRLASVFPDERIENLFVEAPTNRTTRELPQAWSRPPSTSDDSPTIPSSPEPVSTG